VNVPGIREKLRRLRELVDEFDDGEFMLLLGMMLGRLVRTKGRTRARELVAASINVGADARRPDA
jgi:hypothetical protein